jgi:hypothetical protein
MTRHLILELSIIAFAILLVVATALYAKAPKGEKL